MVIKGRKPFYVGIAFITFVLGIAVASWSVFPIRTFQLISQDGVGGPGLGVSGKGMGAEMRSWVSSDGMSVEETVVAYSTDDDARNDFELELRAAEQVIELSRKSFTTCWQIRAIVQSDFA